MKIKSFGKKIRIYPIFSSQFLQPIFSIFIFFWLIFGFIIAVDPYDLYDWGQPPRLLEDYNRTEVHYLYSAASRAEVDILLLGGSTLAGIRANDLIQAFPHAESAFNFSPIAPRPRDREVILNLVNQNSPADHIIVGLDWIYALPEYISHPNFPLYLFDQNPLNNLRLVTPNTLTLALIHFVGEPLALPGWEYEAQVASDRRSYARFQSRILQQSWQDQIQTTRATIDPNAEFTCASFPLVTEVLMPALEAFVSNGRSADILVPPPALVQYHTWSTRENDATALVEPFFEKQMAMRRCVTTLAQQTQEIRIFAFDTRASITADLGNYRDPLHLNNPNILEEMIADMAAGNNELTLENFDTYRTDLTEMVLGILDQIDEN